MKCIPTKYNGYQFRSRLEARWAVFLDLMQIEWRYEHEGYQLDSGWYVPDFFLPELNSWLEIKPPGVLCEHSRELNEKTGLPAFVSQGGPGDGMTLFSHFGGYGPEIDAYHRNAMLWTAMAGEHVHVSFREKGWCFITGSPPGFETVCNSTNGTEPARASCGGGLSSGLATALVGYFAAGGCDGAGESSWW